MHYAFVIPGGDARTCAELAYEAEQAGWDGVFIPDCIDIEIEGEATPSFGHDPWIVMAAMAMRTEHVRIGAMITAVSRRRPWKLARETVTLDHLSNGRLIFQAGLGALDDGGFGKVGETTDRKTRAELLDESLAILSGLWSGKPFHFDGKHYHIQEMTFLPPPVQSPRIPVWVVGAWPRMKSMQRVLHWDGILPNKITTDGFGEMTPDDIRAMKAYITEQRVQLSLTETPFDIVHEGRTPGDDRQKAVEQVQPYVEAGITWWVESMWSAPNSVEDVRTRIQQGPPKAV